MLQDLRFALRMLRRTPGVSILAVVCLTAGIGATAAVLSWIEGILLRPYPLVASQERLVAMTGTNRGGERDDVSWPDFKDLERGSRLAEAFIAEKITGSTLTLGDRAERVLGSMVSANYFDAIGVRPVVGRGFMPGDDIGRNSHPVTVISYQMWQDRFHRDPNVIGQTQVLAGLPHTIVGVAPEGFYGTFVGYAFQFWVPASMQAQFDGGAGKLDDRGARWIEGFVRLKPGVTIDQAQTELSALAGRLEAAYPETNRGRGVRLYPLWQTPFNNAGAMLPTLGIALVVVIAVLLIACANVGNLLLVRAMARRQEMTIRVSIGAGRLRLVRQLMTEGIVLSAIAGIGGLFVADWLQNAIAVLTPPRGGVMLRLPGALDWRVVALTGAVCLAATMLFGLVPAITSSRVDLAGTLRAEAGGVIGSHRRSWVRSTLVLIQVSLSFVLLVGAGLLLQTLQGVRHANPGFATDNVLTTSIDLFTAGYDPAHARNFQSELIDRLQDRAGVESVALSRSTPFSYRTYSSAPIAVDGYDAPADQQPTVDYNEISPAFLATMGIPLVSGREFTRADDEASQAVAIVDETIAAQFFRGVNPVGRRIELKGKWLRIVGLARAVKYRNLLETPRPFLYVPLRQSFSLVAALHIRTVQAPTTFAPILVREIHALDANLAPGEVITMREQVERTTAPQRIGVTILVVFAALALGLATIGLYGVMAATVSYSTRELALRTALGANAGDLLRLVVSRSIVLTVAGIAVGAAVALQATRLLGYLLYNVRPRDPLAFGGAIALVVLASLVAILVPAWRATRTDPVAVLRG
jgi:predicted permease